MNGNGKIHLSEADRREIEDRISRGLPLDDRFRFLLFGDKRQVELVWNGKSNDFCSVALPFQTIEQVDEPRDEKFLAAQPGGLFTPTGRQQSGWANKLIWGDNRLVLASLTRGPIRDEIEQAGGLKLIYIDPPFDVGADFSMSIPVGNDTLVKEPSMLEKIAYRDTWGKGADSFVAMIHERIALMHDLLANDGSIYVHCDWRVNGHIRQVLDEVFGADNFRNTIVWHYGGRGGKAVSGQFPRNHDTLFFYSKGDYALYNKQYRKEKIPFQGSGYRLDENGRCFTTAPRGHYTDDSIRKFEKEGRIHRTATGTIRIKRFVEYVVEDGTEYVYDDKIIGDVWNDIPDAMHIPLNERFGYPTQKSEALLERVIKASSNEGDLVADFFAGPAQLPPLLKNWGGNGLRRTWGALPFIRRASG